MKSIIVGTAGHIDHGKTALVKALTGIDADRLQEEKRRGITIDLGFAHMDLAGRTGEILHLGFVDVPGHERFVRNMLAGVGGIDLVLLVIAADESIKPQTREHFEILQLLGVKRGVTVLTKSDAVDRDTLDVVRLEVEDFLRGTFLEPANAPIVAVSSLTGAGLDDLKQAIASAVAGLEPRDSLGLARLPIDRVFTMKGFGTVVTGTLISGTIRKEEELEVFPTGRRVRVRGVQVHGNIADAAVAGQRTALNLTGATTEDLTRGMTLAPPGTFLATRRLDVQLNLLKSAPRPLASRTRIHFHVHTMETVAELRLHGKNEIGPGETGFARILLSQGALLVPGDRFIIRQFSPVITIGGGVVLDATPMHRSAAVPEFLNELAGGKLEAILEARIRRRRASGIAVKALVAESGLSSRKIDQLLAGSLQRGRIVRFGETFVGSDSFKALTADLIHNVEKFQKQNPLQPGIGREQLRDALETTPQVFEAALAVLVKNGKLEVAGDVVRIAGHGVVMKDEEAESKQKIEEAFATAGLKVPALHEVLGGLKVDKQRAQKIVTLLLRERVLIKVSDELVFHHKALERLRQQIAAQKTKSPKIDVGGFKELIGVSRKYAIPLLEYLDRERVTKRVGDARQIL
ncbi:MAG TPA: selenocysteine-specific translation elongation factor [Candidatus Sulfotelmatobacter sp.]|nr:selenocysteine-specific translation elongation factor [Candidatus Sulfotelmatobacter sp.]